MASSNGQDIKYEVHEKDEPLKASANEFGELEDSLAWQDVVMTIDDRIDILHEALENAETLEEIRGLQYSILELKAVKNLPSMLKEYAKIEQQEHIQDK